MAKYHDRAEAAWAANEHRAVYRRKRPSVTRLRSLGSVVELEFG
jgi:hypothetical protein